MPPENYRVEDKFDPIRKGLLEFAVLTVISSKKVYAADILEILNSTEFKTQEGTLYPLLSRLRRDGTVEYEWVESAAGPPRKYYRLTDSGKDQLSALRDYWQKLSKTLKQK
jgi:PadR family transcriptional regulator PadR